MNDLLDFVLDAHGGLNRWSGVSTLTAKLAAGGPFWGQQGFPDAFLDETLTIDTRRQHAVFTPWTAPGQSLTFDTDPERVVLQDASGQAIARRTSPRSSSAGRDPSPPWDALQVGYFLSYGMWNYLTTPFLLTYPGVQAREISPWQEDGQTWRRLHATFPASITTHSAGQVFYFGADGLLRRLGLHHRGQRRRPSRALHRGLQDLRRPGLPHPPPRLPPQPRQHPRPQPGRHHARYPRHHRRLTPLRRNARFPMPAVNGRSAAAAAHRRVAGRPTSWT